MNTSERKCVNEVLALYEFERVKDLYVEGCLDKSIMDWFLQKHGRRDVTVYTAEILDVSTELLGKYHLPFPSNRSKLIALSYELASHHRVSSRVLCVVDRDFDDVLGKKLQNRFLTFTDFNSMESYVLANDHVRKFVTVALGNMTCNIDTLIKQLIIILKYLFYIRAANERLAWGMKWICPKKYVDVGRDRLIFDHPSFVSALLNKNNRHAQGEDLQSAINYIMAISSSDDRFVIRGHDLMDLLLIIANKWHLKRKSGDESLVSTCGDISFFSGAFLASLSAEDLACHELFKNVLNM